MISRLLRPALGLQQLSRSLFSVHQFTKLNELNEYLSTNKPTFTVVYFRAAWNPQCEEADRHIDQLSKEFNHVNIIKIDSDKAPMIARHYSVKSEPEFVVCLYGDEFVRQIGPNLSGLKHKLETSAKAAQDADLKDMAIQWNPYGTAFEQYYNAFLKHRLAWNK